MKRRKPSTLERTFAAIVDRSSSSWAKKLLLGSVKTSCAGFSWRWALTVDLFWLTLTADKTGEGAAVSIFWMQLGFSNFWASASACSMEGHFLQLRTTFNILCSSGKVGEFWAIWESGAFDSDFVRPFDVIIADRSVQSVNYPIILFLLAWK